MSDEGESFELIESLAGQLGVGNPEVDSDGLARLELQNGQVFYLKAIKGGGYLAFSQLVELPEDTDVEVFRTLLAANLFGAGTGMGHFALEDTTGALVWQARLMGTVGELAQQLMSAADLCRQWTDRLVEFVASSNGGDGGSAESEDDGEGGDDAGIIRV